MAEIYNQHQILQRKATLKDPNFLFLPYAIKPEFSRFLDLNVTKNVEFIEIIAAVR